MTIELPSIVTEVAQTCKAAGGQAWIVGGLVRDTLMGLPSKDIDIEVHGIEADVLIGLLRKLGRVNEIGKSFGVFKLVQGDVDLDISIPRRDSQVGPAHNDVEVVGDPHMGIQEAARRRDLTINAIAYDPLTHEYADPFGGIHDIERGRLSAVDSMTFLDDPLRALRVVQFAARFGFSVHEDLFDICSSAKVAALPAERIWTEFEKLLMKSAAPSIGWNLAKRTRLLAQVLPELAHLPTSQMEAALDRAAEARDDMGDPGRATALMVATLVHRLPVEQAEETLNRLKLFALHGYPVRKRVLEAVTHWQHLQEPRSTRELYHFADQTEVLLVATVAWAATGKSTSLGNIDLADRLGIAETAHPPLLKGRDLTELGVPQGPGMGALLDRVRTAQNDGVINDRSQALAWLRDTLDSDDY